MTISSFAQRLTLSLDAVAVALASVDIEGLLAAEARLSSALADVSRIRAVDVSDREAVGRQLTLARAALARCFVLGRSASDATHAALHALGRSADYERSGARMADTADVVAHGSALKTRM
jgi:hypothetical protein